MGGHSRVGRKPDLFHLILLHADIFAGTASPGLAAARLIPPIPLLRYTSDGKRRLRWGSPGLVGVFADGDLLALVLICLVKNALRAPVGCPGVCVRVDVLNRKQYTLDCVWGTGERMVPELLDDILCRFLRSVRKTTVLA